MTGIIVAVMLHDEPAYGVCGRVCIATVTKQYNEDCSWHDWQVLGTEGFTSEIAMKASPDA